MPINSSSAKFCSLSEFTICSLNVGPASNWKYSVLALNNAILWAEVTNSESLFSWVGLSTVKAT